jgi:hypothetical protein
VLMLVMFGLPVLATTRQTLVMDTHAKETKVTRKTNFLSNNY